MARDTNALRPAFDEDEDLLLGEEEEPKEPEPENEPDNAKPVESQDREDDQEEDQEEVDYLAELAKKQKQRKQLRKLEREIKEEPTVRKTFLVEEELLNIILGLSKKYGYAFQTKFINSAIKRELMRIGHYPPKKRMG
jgi:hypothetical protein